VRALVVAFVVLVVACKPSRPPQGGPQTVAPEPAPEPTPPAQRLDDAELEALMRQVAELMAELADAVEAERDCIAMSVAINRVVDDHAAVLERMRALKDPSIEDRAHAWVAQHGEQLETYAERAGAAVQRCAGEPEVDAAMERLSAVDVESKDRVPVAVEDSVRLYEAIGRLAPGMSCAESAAAIDRLIVERGAALRTVRTAARDRRRDQVDARFVDAAGRLGSALAAIERLAVRCDAEPALAAALAQLEGG
jgi:hypothetical protein